MAGGGCALVLLGPLFGGEVVGATSVGSSACVYSFLSIFLNSACECERGDIGIHSLRPCRISHPAPQPLPFLVVQPKKGAVT